MPEEQLFWDEECERGDPDIFVCMTCLNEAFWRRIPNPGCPSCHAVSSYEPFAFESIQEWGSEELIAKALDAQKEAMASRLLGQAEENNK